MLRRLPGLLLAAAAIACVLMPLQVAEVVGAAPTTSSDTINLRASYGGSLLGLALFLLALPPGRPLRASLIHAILYLMVGIGAARLLGFVLDGNPDQRQWIWLIAEVVIVAVCLGVIRHRRSG